MITFSSFWYKKKLTAKKSCLCRFHRLFSLLRNELRPECGHVGKYHKHREKWPDKDQESPWNKMQAWIQGSYIANLRVFLIYCYAAHYQQMLSGTTVRGLVLWEWPRWEWWSQICGSLDPPGHGLGQTEWRRTSGLTWKKTAKTAIVMRTAYLKGYQFDVS